ncbi:MAG: type II secretion system F family protein [Lachnospiraceae bacterium]|nr:type II secretion system F family protein [Lachnospiraceae bacterium]
MLVINIVVFVMFFMLYMLSRKHYSKYKNVFWKMGGLIYGKSKKELNTAKKKSDFRKIKVVSNANLDELTELYYIKIISICMVVIFVINAACMILAVYHVFSGKNSSNIIERGDYGDDVSSWDVYVGVDSSQEVYELTVYPRQYTEDEFYQKAEEVFTELKSDILADNEDLQHINGDLILPSSDDSGIFEISWWSDYPEYISSSGKVYLDELQKATEVNLTAKIAYLEFSVQENYHITLVPVEVSDDLSDVVGEVLKEIEADNRSKSSIELPKEISGHKISLKQRDNSIYKQLLGLGIIMCTITIMFSNSNLKEKMQKRDNMLMNEYASFVNKLWLLLGTGMTIKNCFIRMIDEAEEKNILVKELEYTVNQINSGFDEATAYDELGIRLALPQYTRLMNRISQNLRMGTKDLRILMRDEVRESMESRKEYAKKKGEEASTKLLVPMILLMTVVIVIIMVPAFVGL